MRICDTVFLIISYTPSFLLEIRVIIKMSHPWYPINCDWFEYKWSKVGFFEKKQQNDRLKKTEIFNSANSQYLFAKISRIGPWVSRINWWEGNQSGLTDMVVRLSHLRSKQANFPWKAVKVSWVARMGRNFDDYPGF